MNFRSFSPCIVAIAIALAPVLTGCAGRKTFLHAEAIAARGVRVSPSDVYSNGGVLVVKLNVMNQASAPLVLDKNAVRLTLVDGRIVSPASRGDRTKTLEPEASELVRIDFRADGFRWKDVTRAQLDLSNAMLVGGAPTALPPMELVLGDLKGPPLAQIEDRQITIAEQIQFRTGSSEILPESEPIVIAVAEILASTPKISKIRIEGHTDAVGAPATNLELSRRRAAAVTAALVARGVSRDRLDSAGFGDQRPLEPNSTDEGRQRNRRVEFHIQN